LDDQSLKNVLGILRLLKLGNPGDSAVAEIRKWAGDDASEIKILKIASYILEQASLARAVIAHSQLAEEAKRGVLTTIDSVINAFAITGMQSRWDSHVRDVAAAISNIVILLSAMGIKTDNEAPQEAIDLVAEIEAMIVQFDDPELDPAVRDVAKRHLSILATLLRHIPIFGLEPALVTYFELMMKMRRTDSGSAPSAQSKLVPLFEGIKSWGERLTALDKLWNAGAKLLAHAGKAQDLLAHLPHQS